MFRLARYGKDVIIKIMIISLILFVISFLINLVFIKYILIIAALLLSIFTIYFFRNPVRKIPEFTEDMILSPADGKIVEIKDYINDANIFLNSNKNLVQVSIFMSPLNVHINRIPVSGTVKYLKYIKGKYTVAFNHKSSVNNERTEIGIEDIYKRKVLFKQIAGFVARRIVCELSEGNNVKCGDIFGMIKFGSRVDVIFDKNSTLKVKIGEEVKGGETIIAKFN